MCLKFCFLNSVAFCAKAQIKVDLQLESFSRVTLGPAFPVFGRHYSTVSGFLGFLRVSLGSRFSGFYRVSGPGFLLGPARVPLGSRFSGFYRVPLGSHQGPGFPVFVGCHQGPGFLVYRVLLGSRFSDMSFTNQQLKRKSAMVTPNILHRKIKPMVLIVSSNENSKLIYFRIKFYCFFIVFSPTSCAKSNTCVAMGMTPNC